jgi:small subunit ribosomal protein S17
MERNKRKVRIGKVVKLSGQNTIKVLVTTKKKHSIYNKYIKVSKNYLVDAPGKGAKVGDNVMIMESRPISAQKSWRLYKNLEKSLPVKDEGKE